MGAIIFRKNQESSMSSIFDQDLPQTPANHAPLSPLSFIERSAQVYPDRLAVVHGSGLRRCGAPGPNLCALSPARSALAASGVRKGDTVAVMLPNTPPMVEAHFGVPMPRSAQCAQHRLDADMIAFMLDHGEPRW